MNKNIENIGDVLVSQNKVEKGSGCLQPVPHISLTDDRTIINLNGYKTTVGDLKEHVIDSYMFRKHLQELMDKKEEVI